VIELIIGVGGGTFLLILSLITGTIIEHNHLKSLTEREARLRLGVTNFEPGAFAPGAVELCAYVDGQAVIAADRFKVFLGRLVSIFGGELKVLTSVMARARREAILRMLERAEEMGADQVWNVRLETSNIGRGDERKRQWNTMAEIHAYGTAIKLRKHA
jgi:uncharacterized protein YbjQ (UPF0145 family)